MSPSLDSTLLDTLTPVQTVVLHALAAGATVTAAAREGGVHRSTVHLWTRQHPAFARALLASRQDRAETLLDELAALSQLALDTFRHILSDENTSAAARLKAALEIVKLVQSQQPTELALLQSDLALDAQVNHPQLAGTAAQSLPRVKVPTPVKVPARNAPCPCGSPLKYKRCCGVAPASPPAQAA